MKSIMPTTNKKYQLLIILAVALVLAGFWQAHHASQVKQDLVLVEVKPITSSFGWGYEIVAGGKVYIRQEFIPAIYGKHGFRTSEDAVKVGKKVVSKINAKQLPPTITIDELREMGIINDTMVSK
jgi:hypothetical protein